MSATEEEDLAPGGQDSTVGAVGGGSGVVSDPGPVKGVGVPAAGEAGTGAPQAEQEQGLPRASTPRAKQKGGAPRAEQQQGGAPRAEQEQARPEGALAGAQASASAEEDSDIGPADEDEEGHEGGQGQMVDAHQFPMTGFRGVFLDLIYLLLRHISYNDHVLIRSRGGGRVVVRHRPPHRSCPLPPALPPPAHGGAMAAGEPVDQAAAPEPVEPPDEAAAPEPREPMERPDEAAAPEPAEPADKAAAPQEATQYQHENSDEETQKAGGEEEKEAEEEKENKNEEQEPKKDLDPAEGRPGKYS